MSELDKKAVKAVLDRLRRWRNIFGEPIGNGRANPDNDMWFLLLDAEECIAGLQSYARSLEKTIANQAADAVTKRRA